MPKLMTLKERKNVTHLLLHWHVAQAHTRISPRKMAHVLMCYKLRSGAIIKIIML